MSEVIWTQKAIEDVDRYIDYLNVLSPQAAQSAALKIRNAGIALVIIHAAVLRFRTLKVLGR